MAKMASLHAEGYTDEDLEQELGGKIDNPQSQAIDKSNKDNNDL
jgi:hypothetical protein